MKTINSWNDLRPYGIDALTGEACGLSYRILCDVTARGKQILVKLFSVMDLVLAESWNQGCDDEPHIGSILLVPEMLTPLAVFALLESGCREVWLLSSGGVVGMEPTDSAEPIAAFKQHAAGNLVRRFTYGGTAGDRNVHQFTGRIQ